MNIAKSLSVIAVLVMSLTSFSMNKRSMMIAAPLVVTEKVHKGLNEFLEDLARRESNGKYWITSKRGYLGKYQFHQSTLHKIGINVSDSAFLANESLQDSAEILLLKNNSWSLRDVIRRYRGHWVKGIYISKSGILAGSHLVGTCGVRAFFNDSIPCPTEDANGTTVEDYMQLFARYTINL